MRKLHEIAADQDEDLTSRSDIKRARKVKEEALARLAKELVGLGERTMAKLKLPEDVLDPVVDAQRIQSPIALERQLRVVRRALRDASWPEIRTRLDHLLEHGTLPKERAASGGTHEREWVVRLMGEGQRALEELIADHPTADRKHLRQLIRNVQTSNVQRKKRAEEKLAAAVRFLLDHG